MVPFKNPSDTDSRRNPPTYGSYSLNLPFFDRKMHPYAKRTIQIFFYRTYSVDSSESSSDEASDKDVVREEVEELNKVLADLVRENRELEVSITKFEIQICNIT